MRMLLACSVTLASVAIAQERVEVPAAGLSNASKPLVGYLFEPKGSGAHPAVVMVHGCGGAYRRSGNLNERHQMWGEYLAENGYVALMLDSFTSRGIKELCTQKMSSRDLKAKDRAGDAYAGLAYLRARKDVDPKRIALLGWSHGGSTVLNAMVHAPAEPRFQAAIAFYPGCTPFARSPGGFHPYVPLLVLMGEADDWTPAAPCRTLNEIVSQRPEPMELVLYPGAYHDFDNPGITKAHVRKEVPNGVHPGKGVTVAPDAAAREDAKKRVLEFLRRMISPEGGQQR